MVPCKSSLLWSSKENGREEGDATNNFNNSYWACSKFNCNQASPSLAFKLSSHHVCWLTANNIPWAWKNEFLWVILHNSEKLVWPAWSWTDSSISLEERQSKNGKAVSWVSFHVVAEEFSDLWWLMNTLCICRQQHQSHVTVWAFYRINVLWLHSPHILYIAV